jgi:Ca2+-binding RTX toxin-like protein
MVEQLESRRLLSVDIVNGVVQINGTSAADNIRLWQSGSDLVVSFNGKEQTISAAIFTSIWVDAGAGNDYLSAGRDFSKTPHPASPFACTILGGSGHDTLLGSDAADLLVGGAGNDTIEAGEGNDTVNGGRGDDLVDGGHGTNALYGAGGRDTAQTWSEDDLVDGAERVLPVDRWVSNNDWDAALDLRVKHVTNRGFVAVLDFYWGPGNRVTINSINREGNTFRITVGVESWTGGTIASISHELKTVTLGQLPAGDYSTVVQRTDGTVVDRQRFTSSVASVDI